MSEITQLICNNFGGIRRKNSMFSQDTITCSDCQNVELFYTKLNSGVGLRTAKGNSAITIDEGVSIIPSDEEIIDMYKTNQGGVEYHIIYTEKAGEGKLYNYNKNLNTITLLKGSLTPSGVSCATDFVQGVRDEFIFSNGNDIVYIYTDTETGDVLQIEPASSIHLPQDPITGDTGIVGLGLVVYDSRLWMFKGKTLYYSQKLECRNFVPGQSITITSPGYIERVKDITAIHLYLGSLAVFHKDSSCLVAVDNLSTTEPTFNASEESPGGCAGHKALVFHGTDLYFYDNTKKGVFSFQQIVNGDKTLGQNIAYDIQEELMEISEIDCKKIKAVSVVTSDRNEVWFLTPINVNDTEDGELKRRSLILIFDYIRGEWVKRKSQHINTIAIINNSLLSAGDDIYAEYVGDTFNGEYITANYVCSIFNYNADNSMKITKFPPRLTVDGNSKCNFWVKYVKNYSIKKRPKEKEIKSKQYANTFRYNTGVLYNSGYIYVPKVVNSIVKLPSANFKALEITFQTKEIHQAFAIKAIEFSKIKVKQI